MRAALLALAVLVLAGCGAAPRVVHRPAADMQWPPVAEATRMQWYRGVEGAAPEPVALNERELEAALEDGAAAAGVALVRTHYLPLLGGTAEIVVQPRDPVLFAQEAGAHVATVIGPLGHDNRPYLITVIDAKQSPLLVLGWTPDLGGGLGEGVVWQAPGIRSSAIVGQVETRDDTLPATTVGVTSK
jgi:hypothetical protein